MASGRTVVFVCRDRVSLGRREPGGGGGGGGGASMRECEREKATEEQTHSIIGGGLDGGSDGAASGELDLVTADDKRDPSTGETRMGRDSTAVWSCPSRATGALWGRGEMSIRSTAGPGDDEGKGGVVVDSVDGRKMETSTRQARRRARTGPSKLTSRANGSHQGRREQRAPRRHELRAVLDGRASATSPPSLPTRGVSRARARARAHIPLVDVEVLGQVGGEAGRRGRAPHGLQREVVARRGRRGRPLHAEVLEVEAVRAESSSAGEGRRRGEVSVVAETPGPGHGRRPHGRQGRGTLHRTRELGSDRAECRWLEANGAEARVRIRVRIGGGLDSRPGTDGGVVRPSVPFLSGSVAMPGVRQVGGRWRYRPVEGLVEACRCRRGNWVQLGIDPVGLGCGPLLFEASAIQDDEGASHTATHQAGLGDKTTQGRAATAASTFGRRGEAQALQKVGKTPESWPSTGTLAMSTVGSDDGCWRGRMRRRRGKMRKRRRRR